VRISKVEEGKKTDYGNNVRRWGNQVYLDALGNE